MPVSGREKGNESNSNWCYLESTVTDWEADVIAALLEASGIPTVRQYPGNSSIAKIYLGSSFGVELYVPAEYLETARSLLSEAGKNKEEPDENKD